MVSGFLNRSYTTSQNPGWTYLPVFTGEPDALSLSTKLEQNVLERERERERDKHKW